jgi:hypothetical protein
LTPEFLDAERDKIKDTYARSNRPEPSYEELNKIIFQKIRMQKKKVDFGNRNFMIPSYHTKTHFKAATTLQLQCEPSLMSNVAKLREDLNLRMYKPDPNFPNSSSMLSDASGREPYIQPADFTKEVLRKC